MPDRKDSPSTSATTRSLNLPVAHDAPPIPPDEAERLEAVRDLNLQDAEILPELIALRDTAQRLLGVQTAVITNIETDVMRILTARMLPGREPRVGRVLELHDFEVPRDCTICQSTIMQPDHLVVPDLERFILTDAPGAFAADFRDLSGELGGYPTPWPMEDGTMGVHGSRFYAGATIRSAAGRHLGTFCVMDEEPQPDFGIEKVELLESLARLAAEYMERRALLDRPPSYRLLERLAAREQPSTTATPELRDVDVVVIGGGPAGVTLACRLAFHDLSVVLVEPKEHFGAPSGVVSKILREAGLRHGSETTWEHVGELMSTIAPHDAKRVRALLEQYGAEVVRGTARVESLDDEQPQGGRREIVHVEREGAPPARYRARATAFATGSQARHLDSLPYDGTHVFDSDSIALLDRKPRSMLVQGGGLIGVEYAMIFARMGVRVALGIRCARERMLPRLDRALTDALLDDLEALEVELLFETDLAGAERSGDGVLVRLQRADEQTSREVDVVLSAVGRLPYVKGVGLEALYEEDVPLERGAPAIDGRQRLKGVDAAAYAIGDVSGGPGLACHAVLQAQRATDDLLPLLVQGRAFLVPEPPERSAFVAQAPSVVWTIPELAFVGASEQQAVADRGAEQIVCGTACFSQTVRGSLVELPACWFVKLVCLKSDGRVLGVHLYGEGASELVHYGASLVGNRTTAFDMQYRSFPAVTLHEVYRVAATQVVEALVQASR